jgi:hypothetical protein
MKRPRPYIPLYIRTVVSEKLVRSLGGLPLSGGRQSFNYRIRFNLNLAARIKGLTDDSTWHLDHDRPLAARDFNERTGKYTPDANDPEHLFYITDEEHRVKTLLRGARGQYSDIALIKRERRRNRPAKPKRKIPPSRPFPKRSRTIDH